MDITEINSLTDLDNWLKKHGLEAVVHNVSYESDQRIAGNQITINIRAGGFIPETPSEKKKDILELTADLLKDG